MRTRFMLGLGVIALGCFAFLPSGAYAQADSPQPGQEAPAATHPEAHNKSESMRTLTGCLAAGDEAGEFKLTAEDGSTWELHSRKVKLEPHAGHTVTVTGHVWHAGMHGAKEKAKEAVEPNATEHGHLRVTSLKMVSESCKK